MTVRCYTVRAVDLAFDLCSMILENPIQMWLRWVKYMNVTTHLQLPMIWRIAGLVVTYLILNLLALFYLRVADVIIQVWKICKVILQMPLFILLKQILSGMYAFLISLPKAEKDKKRRKTDRQDEGGDKSTNAVYVPNNPLFREMRERLSQQQQKAGQQSSNQQGEKKGKCFYCGLEGHREKMCLFKEILKAKRSSPEKEPKEAVPKKESVPPMSRAVTVVYDYGRTTLHTPMWLNGVRFPRCLIDTGSEVNLISVRDAIKHGMEYEFGGIQAIKGFNGVQSPVDGLMPCKIRLGPRGEEKEAEFLVTSLVTIPIIGFPTLSDL